MEEKYSQEWQALPTPADTPYRTPASRRSSHRRRSSSQPRSSSPQDQASNASQDSNNRDGISPLDPRRFTPTLHASLVSEILSLRRDMESKVKIIEDLEVGLDDARTENEELKESVANHTKQSHGFKRQVQILESEAMNAMGQLAKERDEAVDTLEDTKQRLEQAQKRLRTEGENSEKMQALWDGERETWDSEKRRLETKVHIVEARLKTVLGEIAAAQSTQDQSAVDHDGIHRDNMQSRASDNQSVRSSSALRQRSGSVMSNSTVDGEGRRASIVGGVSGQLSGRAAGQSLADELAFDEEDEDNMSDDGYDSPDALPEEMDYRPMSAQSRFSTDSKARRLLGLVTQEYEAGAAADTRTISKPPEIPTTVQEVEEKRSSVAPEYTDTGVQFTPPGSPQFQSQGIQTLSDDKMEKKVDPVTNMAEVVANEGRKRTISPTTGREQSNNGPRLPPLAMSSTSCQTVEDVPTPPWTPLITKAPEPLTANEPSSPPPTSTASTQTEEAESNTMEDQPLRMLVPTIAIHPPESRPSTANNGVVLPPHTKNASSQTDASLTSNSRSVSMQTEEIRVDKRPLKLPDHLQPSAIRAQMDSEERRVYGRPDKISRGVKTLGMALRQHSPPPVRPRDSMFRYGRGADFAPYPPNNDTGPLVEDSHTDIKRPYRTSSLFAGFDNVSDEEQGNLEEDAFDDDDLFSRPVKKYTLKSGKLVSRPPSTTPVPEERSVDSYDNKELVGHGQPRIGDAQNSRSLASSKTDIRRTALVSSGAAAHQMRSRSPSEPSIGSSTSSVPPPFPVPNRSSSRKLPLSLSEGGRSPTPLNGTAFSYRKHDNTGKAARRQPPPMLRKSQSAVAVSGADLRRRDRSRSPPPETPSSSIRGTSEFPPLPIDDITAPGSNVNADVRRPQYPSNNSFNTRSDSVSTSVHPPTVVDAIAQTMVGEWMWKYVRKSTAFAKGEPGEVLSASGSSGTRHKRWVWLAPYERTVMWNTKQPTTGTALMGKGSRKCKQNTLYSRYYV